MFSGVFDSFLVAIKSMDWKAWTMVSMIPAAKVFVWLRKKWRGRM